MKLYLPINAWKFFNFFADLSNFHLLDLSEFYKLFFGWAYLVDQRNRFDLKDQEDLQEEDVVTDSERLLQKKRNKISRSQAEDEEEQL